MTVQRIREARKWMIGAGTLLLVASMATCHFGIEHEIGKIPPDVRARMADADWVGAEWAVRSVFIDLVAMVVISVGVLLWFYERRKLNEAGTTILPMR